MKHLGLAFLLVGPAFAQDELKPDDVIAKIEERVKPIDTLSARVTFQMPEFMMGGDIAGTLTFKRGEFLQTDMILSERGNVFLMQRYSDCRKAAVRLVSVGNQPATFLAQKIDLSRPARGGTILATLQAILGLDSIMIDVALFPNRVKALGTNLKAGLRKEGDKEYVFLSVQAPFEMPGISSANLTYAWFFDAKTYRLEKLEEDWGLGPMVRPCDGYTTVNGVELPNRIEFLVMGYIGTIAISIDRFDPKADVKAPRWLDDPALPMATDESTEALSEQLAKDPNNAPLAVSLINSMSSSLSNMRGNQNPKELATTAAKALKAQPGSPTVNLLAYGIHQTAGDKDAADKVLQQIVNQKIDCPEAFCLHAVSLLKQRNWKEAAEAAARIGDAMPGMAAKVTLLSQIGQATTTKEVVELLDKALSQKVATLDELVSSPSTGPMGVGSQGVLDGRDAKFFSELHGKTELEHLAARGLAKAGQPKEAAAIYETLAADKAYLPAVLDEIQGFCHQNKSESEKLVDRLFDNLKDTTLLLEALEARFDDKDKFDRGLKRLIELKKAGWQSKHEMMMNLVQQQKGLKDLIKKLLNANRQADAQKLVLAYAERQLYDFGGPPIDALGGFDMIKQVLGGDQELSYEFLKKIILTADGASRLSLKAEDALVLIEKRLNGSTADELDVEALAQFIADKELRKAATPERLAAGLEKGVKLFSRRFEFQERLADAYFLGGKYPEAAGAYIGALKCKRETPAIGGPFQRMMVVTHIGPEGPGQGFVEFSVTEPMIVKLTRAYLKNNESQTAGKALDRFVRENPDEPSNKEALWACKLLNDRERTVRMTRDLFRLQARSPAQSWNRYPEVIDTGLELAKLYLEDKKYEQAYVVSGKVYELAKSSQQNSDGLKKAEALQSEVQKVFGDEERIKALLAGSFATLDKDKTQAVRDGIEKLDDDDPAVREEACKKLRAFPDAAPALNEARKDKTPEVAKRLRDILLEFADRSSRAKFEKE